MENLPVSALMSALLSLSTVVDEPAVATYELPAIAGLWQIDLKNPTSKAVCQERYNFGKDGALMTKSGDEYTKGQYRFDSMVDLPLAVLAIKTTYDNGKSDCSGENMDQTGNTMAMFVRLDQKHNPITMQWCSDPMGNDCVATLHRVLP